MVENLYIAMAISGIFTGSGVAIGTYLSNRYIIKHFEKIEERLLKNEGKTK